MSRGEDLLRLLMDTMEADMGGFEDIKPIIDAEKELRSYIAGLENAVACITEASNMIERSSYVEDSEEFTPRDFNMIEDQNSIIDDINREGFEVFGE
jgi:hypothetical protein